MPAEQPISKAEAAKIAGIIESSVARGNPRMLDNIFDVDVFARRIALNARIKVDADMKKGLSRGLENRHLGAEIIRSVGKNGSYKLLRQYEKAGRQHLLFRLYGEQGVNYQDFELVKTGRDIKAADILIYFTGEQMSETIGNFMSGMSKADQTDANIKNISHIRKLMDHQDYAAAKEAFSHLPTSMQQQKLPLIVNVQICSGLGDNTQYLKAIEEYQSHYPDATNVPLLMIDACFLNNNYPKALDAINNLDRMVGKDPFLDYYRGLVYKLENDTAQYARYIGQVYRYDPDQEDFAMEMINVCLMNRSRDKAAEVISAFRANKSFNQALLSQWLLTKDYP